MNEKATVLSFEEVCFSYGDDEVLHNISFTIDSHWFVGIVGPNGGGKTTLLRLALGLEKPGRGKIHLLGSSPIVSRKNVGYVMQTHQYDNQFPVSVLDVVLMGRIKPQMIGFFKKIEKSRAATPLSSKLGHTIMQLNDHSIQQCLKEISTVDLARALLLRLVTAERVAGGALLTWGTELDWDEIVVIVDQDGSRAPDAWRLLQARDIYDSYLLDGGIDAWLAEFGGGIVAASALGDRHPAALPDVHQALEYEAKVKRVGKAPVLSGGCG